MLFILCIDPLHGLLQAATNEGLLFTLPGMAARMHTCLYADDTVIFINPLRQEIDELLNILHHFGMAIGLRVNLAKSSIIPIACENVDLTTVLLNFGRTIAALPTITVGKIRPVHL